MNVSGFEFEAATGLPAAGLTVEIWPAAVGTPPGSPLASTTTDANGEWGFQDLPGPLAYDVRVSIGGRYRWYKGYNQLTMNTLALENGVNAPGVTKNLLRNPGFEFWSAGVGPFAADAFGPDGWFQEHGAGSALSVTQGTLTPAHTSRYYANIDHTLGTDPSAFYQTIEGGATRLFGSTLSGSFRVLCGIAAAVRPFIDGYSGGRQYGPYHTGSSEYETLEVLGAPIDAGTAVRMGISIEKTCTIYLDNGILNFGGIIGPYEPLDPSEDLQRIERFRERIDGTAGYPVIREYAIASGRTARVSFPFRTRKATVPTITVLTPWTLANCTISAPIPGLDGWEVILTSTVSNDYMDASGAILLADCEA